MGWVTFLAIFFIIWWTTLFAVLPIGIRSQFEENDVAPGTEPGAPSQFSLLKKFLWTTLFSLAIFAAFYTLTQIVGIGPDSFPNFTSAP